MGYRVINVDTTAGTAVVPSTSTLPQVSKTYNLDVSDDEYITVIATFYITTVSATGVIVQDVPLYIAIGANTYTVNIRPAGGYATTNITNKYTTTLTFTAVSRAGDTVNVGLATAGTGDSATIVNVIYFKILAESGTRAGT